MLTHKGTQTIKTERLVLRRFTPDDAEAMYSNWANDERVTEFLTWCPHISPEATRGLLEGWCQSYENLDNYNWTITLDGTPIGSIAVVQINDRYEWAELGYALGHKFWGKGYMTEAASAVIDFLFKEVGVNRVEICHATDNPASGKVAEKCGMTYEGTRREYYKTSDGKMHDLAEHSILRSEWEKK